MCTNVQSDLQRDTLSRVTFRIVPLLFLLYIVAYLDRINVSFAAVQIKQQLRLTDAQYGFGAGIFFVGYLLFQIPSSLILQKVGARRWISFLLIVWGALSSSMALVRSPSSFYGLRFFLGVAEAGFFPGVIIYMKEWFPAAAQARNVAWFMTAAPVAGIAGGPISGALLGLGRIARLAGWQWLFIAEGIPAVILGLVVFARLPEAPESALWLMPAQRQWLTESLKPERQPATNASKESAFSVLASVSVWWLALVYFGGNACSYGMTLWLPMAIKTLSARRDLLTGTVVALPYAVAGIAMVLVGRHSDQTGERRWHVVSPGVVAGICLIASSASKSPLVLIAAMSIGFAGVTSRIGPFWAFVNGLFESQAAAVAIAFINALGNLGGFFGPALIGFTRSDGGSFARGLLALGILLAGTSCLILAVRRPVLQ